MCVCGGGGGGGEGGEAWALLELIDAQSLIPLITLDSHVLRSYSSRPREIREPARV